MAILMSSSSRIRSRYLAVAALVVVIFLHTIYHWSSGPSAQQPLPERKGGSYTAPEISQESIRAELAAHLAETLSPASGELTSCAVMIVSMLYGAHKFPQLQDALDSHRRHSERWGCEFQSLEEDISNRKLYSKHYFLLEMMLHELSKAPDRRKGWLLWVDADSIVVNPAISPEAFLPPDEIQDVFALVTTDHQGLNNGIFYLKVHQSSVDLLTQIIDYPLAHPDDDLGWFGEQRAMERVIQAIEARAKDAKEPSGIAWVPRVWINAFQWEHGFEGEPGHHMVHFAGLAETRLQHMQNWLNELRDNQAKWELPIEDTFYANAIPDFWTEFAANASRTR